MRPIDADALLKSMRDYWGENPVDLRMVNDAPTLDVKPVIHSQRASALKKTQEMEILYEAGKGKNIEIICSNPEHAKEIFERLKLAIKNQEESHE